MKKLLCCVVALCLLASALPVLAEGAGAHTIETRTLNFYYRDPDTVVPVEVHFIDGSDVPYLALSDWASVMYGPWDDATEGISVPTFSMAGNVGTLTREAGYSVDFDCDADTVRFQDFDIYMRDSSDAFMIDMIDGISTEGEDGSVRYFARANDASYERYGTEVTINAGDYGIDFIAEGGECYVPMQTLSDLLMSYSYSDIYYNGEIAYVGGTDAFADENGDLTPMGEVFYSVKPHDRSQSMANFTYNELCLVLDTFYGLKDNHFITSFRELAEETGLAEDLASTDPVEADGALYQLLNLHLDDIHTCMFMTSPASGHDAFANFKDEYGQGQSRMFRNKQVEMYLEARDAVRPDGILPYEEFGNTAYITFDEFDTLPDGVDYYETPLSVETEEDLKNLNTIGLMIYAYQQINRKDSPIENVVLDLSNNRGGDSQAAVYTIAAFLGVCTVNTRNTCSGARVTGNYMIDINLDGRVDEDDMLLTQKRLFCLESCCSFSCGNLVPCAFKESNVVTLLGRASGGGACVVLPLCTADGSSFWLSGPMQLAFLKNGAFYDIDRGAEPDFPLMQPASFYDREALTEFINGIR